MVVWSKRSGGRSAIVWWLGGRLLQCFILVDEEVDCGWWRFVLGVVICCDLMSIGASSGKVSNFPASQGSSSPNSLVVAPDVQGPSSPVSILHP